MEIILSSTSGRPIYEQITLQIKEMIMKGDLAFERELFFYAETCKRSACQRYHNAACI